MSEQQSDNSVSDPRYKVQLDNYSGPLDLLLYLIKREEVDIYNIPISNIATQYLEYVALLKHLDPDHVSDFLVLAATLMEIKSRMLLPKPPPEAQDEDPIDPRLELVQQLLEYKRFKDAARKLDQRGDDHAKRFGRIPAMLEDPTEAQVDLDYVQVWDLLSAFNGVLQQIGFSERRHEVVYDDTPIALHAADLTDRLQTLGGSSRFAQLFEGRQKGEIIGLFLALLELIRCKRVRAEQQDNEDGIYVHLLDDQPLHEADLLAGPPDSEPSPPRPGYRP